MARAQQHATSRDFNRSVNRSRYMSGVHVSRMRNHAATDDGFFIFARGVLLDFKSEFFLIGRIKAAGNCRGTNHEVSRNCELQRSQAKSKAELPQQIKNQMAFEGLPLISSASEPPAIHRTLMESPVW